MPDGETVLFTVTNTGFPSWDDTLVVAQSLTTGTRKVLIEGAADARLVSTGHLVYLHKGTPMAVPFDLRRLEVSGPAVGVVSDVMQAANDLKLYLRDEARHLAHDVLALQDALIGQAEAHGGTLAPGFTHLQPAQPVTFAHQLLAHAQGFARDIDRLRDWDRRSARSPLGAAALAGSAIALRPELSASELGYDAPCENSIDAVGSRDHVAEFLAAARKRPEIGSANTFYRASVPQIFADIDRDKVTKLGVPFTPPRAPLWTSSRMRAACAPVKTSCMRRGVSRPKVVAYRAMSSSASAPWFSNNRSCICQNVP